MKKKIAIYIGFLIVGVLLLVTLFHFHNKEDKPLVKNDTIEDVVAKIVKYQYDSNVYLNDVEALTLHEEIIPIDFPLAKDSIVGGGSCDKCVEYEEAKKYYLKQLSDFIKREQKYSIVEIDMAEKSAIVKIKFKGMYLNQYVYDFQSLIDTFTSLSNDLSENEAYMLNVKALEILNQNLSEYTNKDEEMFVNIYLEKKSGKWYVDNISNIYNQLSGFNYESEQRDNDDRLKKINSEYSKRIKRILDNSKNLLNTKDIFTINYKGGL